uniref:Myotubularin-related protein 1-like n=1 Tax=Dermatophagoides pteronyssinus TaxID=6956 RepID=A0A6P6Y4W6_DERPT|nr:myotubularin-related protein 1-like [Dermatophagoides pteronyssinus]
MSSTSDTKIRMNSGSRSLSNQNNRLSLGSWFNQNDQYDFLKVENRIHRSNSLKQKDDTNQISKTKNFTEPDSVSEMGFPALTKRLSSHVVQRFRRKQRASSVTINPADLHDDILTFDGVLFYLSMSNGLAGTLTTNSKKIVFTSGLVELTRNCNNHHQMRKHNFLKQPVPINPIDTENLNAEMEMYEIDLSNIAEVSLEMPTNPTARSIIYIHCRNFKHAKIGLKQSSAESLYKKLIAEHQRMNQNSLITTDSLSSSTLTVTDDGTKYCRPLIWEYLHDNYHYRVRSDWVKYEKWYVNNFKIQFSQFNELDCACPSLPEIVIVPRKVGDKELESIANMSDGQRVPIITYLHRNNGHMIIRSTTYNSNRLPLRDLYHERIFDDKLNSLFEFNVMANVPSLEEVERAHTKLRKACFKTIRINQQQQRKQNNEQLELHYNIDYCKHFWSKCSSWLYIMAKLLKLSSKLAEIVYKRESIGLVEKFDSNWNCLLSSLVQIILDPERRTIKGFQQLLSKEWLYLSGYKSIDRRFGHNDSKYRPMNCPNHILFLLFLDAVHQLLRQNSQSFEFSSFYLILLLDYQVNSDLATKEKYLEFEINQSHPLMINPLFTTMTTTTTTMTGSKPLRIKTHISHMYFFSKLYFRSLGTQLPSRFTAEELLYINELDSRKLI